jgi:hypothetical protein
MDKEASKGRSKATVDEPEELVESPSVPKSVSSDPRPARKKDSLRHRVDPCRGLPEGYSCKHRRLDQPGQATGIEPRR